MITRESSLVQKVIHALTTDLIKQTLKPGDELLPQHKLAEKFGVSRTVIREAITMLAALGVVESKQGKGTYIKDKMETVIIDPLIFSLLLDKRTPDSFLELRQMVELGMLPVVIEKATEEDISKMQKAIDLLEQNYNTGTKDRNSLCDYDLAFHYAYADSTRNPLLIKIGKTVWEMFRPSIEKAVFEITSTSITDHKLILKSIKERNLIQGIEAISATLRTWKRYTLNENRQPTPSESNGS